MSSFSTRPIDLQPTEVLTAAARNLLAAPPQPPAPSTGPNVTMQATALTVGHSAYSRSCAWAIPWPGIRGFLWVPGRHTHWCRYTAMLDRQPSAAQEGGERMTPLCSVSALGRIAPAALETHWPGQDGCKHLGGFGVDAKERAGRLHPFPLYWQPWR